MDMPYGMITTPYFEWWLHHNPFRRQVYTCPICASDTGCFKDCPAREILSKIGEINTLMHDYLARRKT